MVSIMPSRNVTKEQAPESFYRVAKVRLSNRCRFCELRIKQVRLGKERIAEELKYEPVNT
jgi:hypothetical protein